MMQTCSLIRAVLILAALAAVCTPLAAQTDIRIQRTDSVFSVWDSLGSPGCAVGVIRDGDFVFRKGYGSANLDYQIPITSESVFYIASTSKQFAAASVAMLALRGELSLDDEIRKYVPEIPDYSQTVTVRHLIHHTSGLRDYLTLRSLAGESFEDFFDIDWGIEMLARQKALNFEPGSEHLYSNSGYLLLAEIVQRVSGQTLQEFGRENFFGPLGMDATHWGEDRQMVVPNRVVSYDPRPGGQYRRWVKNFHARGDGNLLTTVDDLLLWDRMFYSPDPEWTRFRELMLTRGVLNNGDTLAYAFGLSHGQYRDKATVAHGGGFLGFRTEMMRFPGDRFTAISLCNLGTTNPGSLVRGLADIWLFGDTGPKAEETEAAAEPGDEPTTPAPSIRLSESELERYAGVFSNENSPFGDFLISVDGERLEATLAGSSISMVPLAPDTFRIVDESIEGRLVFATEGESMTLRIMAPGAPDIPFVRSDFAVMSEADLAELAGPYYSEELDVTYEVVLREGLFALLPNGDEIQLSQSGADQFSGASGTMVLERDENGNVTGFTMNAGRVRGLGFIKR